MLPRKNLIILKNGLHIIWEHRPSYQSVAATCLVGAGSRDDYQNKKGLAHCVEHVIFESQRKGNEIPIFQSILDSGGFINATTGIDSTIFSICTYKDDAIEALHSLTQLLVAIPKDIDLLQREKTVIREEMNLIGQDNKHNIQRVKFRLMGASESLRHSIGGTYRMLKRITIDDIQAFHRQFYVAKNMIVSIVGNLDVQKLLPQIEAIFEVLPSGSPKATQPWKAAKGPRCYFNLEVPFCEMYLFLLYPNLTSHNFAAMEMLTEILVCMPCSRLHQRLRQQEALVYAIDGGQSLFREFGTLDISTTAERRNVVKIAKGIIEEANFLATNTLTNHQLEQLKEQFIKRELLHFEAPNYASYWYANNKFFSEFYHADDFPTWIQNIKALTPDELTQTARSVFKADNIFAYILGRINPWRRYRIRKILRRLGC